VNERIDPPSRSPYRPFLWVAAVLLLGFLGTAAFKSYSDLERARAHEAELEARIEATRGRIEHLTEEIDRVETDPRTLERLAREVLGMVRPEDVVVVLPEEDEVKDPPAADRPARSGDG